MTQDAERCYAAALRILGYRFNSELELRRKLRAKKFEKEIIDAAIVRLRAEKWLDDERFAGAFARARSRKRIGPKRLVLELRAAGVDDEVAQRAVAENVDAELEREQVLAIIRRRAASLETDIGRKKLAAYLLKQGYDAALVADVVGELKMKN
ncbi:MAG TPA: regulatory protein RecX [Thermoanaerobaculia bacterium]|nr:regulatory protein RecX [Thermoanaerobaculia bacterium]